MQPVIELCDFSYTCGNSIILEKLNFTVMNGDWLTVIGPNASGKSTLLKNLLRLADFGKTSGIIRIDGRFIDTYSRRELAKRMAYVPQILGHIPAYTVEEFIKLSRYASSWPFKTDHKKDASHVSYAMSLTKTDSLAACKLPELSGGQRQMVLLACAIAQDTDIILLDEPASFLDTCHNFAIYKLLYELHIKKNKTIIIISHDLNLPFSVNGRVLILKNGKQAYLGNAKKLWNARILDSVFDHSFSYVTYNKKKLVVA